MPATTPSRVPTDRPRKLRLDFPGYGGRGLQKIGWNEWFRTFDERELVFLFQEHRKDGRPSNFFRLDNPHTGGRRTGR